MTFRASLVEIVSEDSSGLLGRAPHWDRIRLKEVAEILNGYAFPSSGFGNDGGMPLIRIRDIDSFETDTRFEGEYDPRYLVETGDLLVGMDGDFNVAMWKGPPALLNQRVCRISPDPKRYHPRLLYYALPGYLGAIHAHTSSVTVKHLSSRTVAEIPLPRPPRSEQDSLVAKLDELFSELDAGEAALERAQRNLERYRASLLKAAVEGRLTEEWRKKNPPEETGEELLQRILVERRKRWEEEERAKYEANGTSPPKSWRSKYKEPGEPATDGLPELPEGWCWGTWEQISDRVTVGFVGRMSDKYRVDGIPFLRGQNVKANRFQHDGLTYIDRDFHREIRKSALEPGDVLIVRSGAVGTTCVVPDSLAVANCSDLVIVKQPRAVISEFGAYFMNSMARGAVRKAQVGSALTHFNTRSAAALAVPLPPMDEQREIVRRLAAALSECDSADATLLRRVERCGGLRRSILSAAFKGRLLALDDGVT